MVLRVAVLDEGALHRLFVRVVRDVDLVHGKRVVPRVIHAGGDGARRRVEVLHLFRAEFVLVQVLGEQDGVLQAAARVGRDEVRYHVLILPQLGVHLLELLDELVVDVDARLADLREDRVRDVFRRHAQLAGDVVFREFLQEVCFVVREDHVVADSGADEDFLHAGQRAQFPEEFEVVRVVGVEVRADRRVETVPVLAGAERQLLFAGRAPELGGGAADVVDVAFEPVDLTETLCLFDDRLTGTRLDDAPFVERQRAEVALAVAPAVRGQGEPDLRKRRDAAGRVVHRMPVPHVGQRVDVVHLLHGQRFRRRVLHDEPAVVIGLVEPPAGDGVGVLVLSPEASGVGLLCFPGDLRVLLPVRGGDLREVRQAYGIVDVLLDTGLVHRAVDERDVRHRDAGVQRLGDLDDGVFAHAVREKVRAGVQKDGALHLIGPVVVVAEAAQGRFDAADDDGGIRIRLPDEVAVHRDRVVRPFAGLAAGAVGVHRPAVFRHGIVVDHRVHVAGGDEEPEAGLAERFDALRLPPVRLGEEPDREPVGFEQPADDGGAEARVVDICIAADIDEVQLFDAPFGEVFLRDRQEPFCHGDAPPLENLQ